MDNCDWSALPVDILGEIVLKLESPQDIIYFSAVSSLVRRFLGGLVCQIVDFGVTGNSIPFSRFPSAPFSHIQQRKKFRRRRSPKSGEKV
ncbi:hypothetical protein SOVF_105060 isoform B [Spinacia oleracea]|nr:hypothetical protein SOVF_105060 isoform B [Spinacia oleracea]